MRLHTLSMTAIGPYVGTERIDFDALAADGLFLFTGPTGAGKSTVLDAVTYALYGKLPGNRDGHLSRLKSDFASADTKPEVTLEVTVASDRLRISRSPAFERPTKRDPQKLTTERASVAVERLVDGAWLGVEGARKEQVANEWLHEKIGLNADQFTQVVLLPQGQFAEFLHANDDVREKLLTSLFDAHRFKEVESWFDDRQRAEMTLADEAGAKVGTLRTRALTVADLDENDLPEVVDVDWFEQLFAQHSASAKETGVRHEIATRLHDEATHRLRAAQQVGELIAERAAALKLRDVVEEQREGIAELRDRVARASAAAAVLPLVQARDSRSAAAKAASTALVAARTALDATEPGLSDQPLADVRGRARALTSERGGLSELINAEQSAAARQSAVAEAETVAKQATRAVEALREKQIGLPAARSAAAAAVTALSEQAAVLDDAKSAVTQLTAALSAAKEVKQLRPRIQQALDFARDKRDDVLGAREHLADLRERRITGMAAEIARELRDGDGCVVCGSITHPNPARPADDAPTVEQIEAAEKTVDQRRAVEKSAETSVNDLRATLAAADAIAAGRSVLDLKEALTAAKKRRTAASSASSALPDALDDVERIDTEIAKADELVAAAQAHRDDQVAIHRDLAAEQARQAKRIKDARAGYESVAERAASIDAAIEVIEAYASSYAAAESAADELAQTTQSASDAAIEAGFDSVDDAVKATLPKKVLLEAQGMIAKFDRDDATVETRLSDPKLVGLPVDAPDLAPLQAAVAETKAAAQEAQAADTVQANRRDRLAEIFEQARTEVAEAITVSARATQIKELALLIRGMGANAKKMNLTAYFLAARLEQVTAVASAHLRVMSSGRYTLRHTDERRTARGHGGLGLEVFDAYTGKPRPPHSLSGGETFIASLSLALGLAEVVTAETGAMTLDSLFIDEGFGSLDPDTLDQAMSVLDGLRQVGRTIGVISHVEEMRTRITNQLVIERTDQGSRVLAH